MADPEFTADAVRVRELLEQAARLIDAGDPNWQTSFVAAQQLAATVTEPVSADDARSRIALFAHHLFVQAGDFSGALDQLADAQAAITRQRERGLEAVRLNDHEWGLRMSRSAVYQASHDLDSAARETAAALDLAPHTLQPEQRHAAALTSLGAIELLREHYPQARDLYLEATARARAARQPELLGSAVIGLAQAQLLCGEITAAGATLTRADALATTITDRAAIMQLRAAVAAQAPLAAQEDLVAREDFAARATATDAYAEYVETHAEFLDPRHHANASQARAHREHLDERVMLAREGYASAFRAAQASGDDLGAVTAAFRLAAATQDAALATTDSALHVEAVELLAQTRPLALTLGLPLLAAAMDVAVANFIRQWELDAPEPSPQRIASAAGLALTAAVFLTRAVFIAEDARLRQDFVRQYAELAYEIGFELSFERGDHESVAELIELRAAGAEFSRSGALGSRLAATAPPPLQFHPQRLLLAEANATAEQLYALEPDPRPAIPTW
ncbi:hypothetical protein EG850_00880 [Gulosibacter macacae]|uniref:MalT-like TPR region domain-containing protein n=1 Tax=Gulosibacter macacae TaxID=2488791 RepID=A0A3P3W0Z2_9MICO|nr:hypothetical protein [Gulosibacter macacae]RRJ88731.1 hypothetical protein EG850_00880 [Gulosibacter macacae]